MNLTLLQAGVGPIVSLGMSPAGTAADLATAPTVSDSQVTDLVLIQRAGRLQKVASTAFAAGLGPALAASITGSLSPTLVTLGENQQTLSIGLASEAQRAEAAEEANTVLIQAQAAEIASLRESLTTLAALPAAVSAASLSGLPAEQQVSVLEAWSSALPTSSAGLSVGQMFNNNGVPTVVQP